MSTDKEFFNVKYKEGSLDPKAAQLILFAVNLAIGHEHGAKLHLGRARELGASEDEIWETVVYAMRPVAANVRNRESRRIQVQVNCEFKDAQGYTIDSTPWQTLMLTENAQETVRFASMNSQATAYTIRIRQAR